MKMERHFDLYVLICLVLFNLYLNVGSEDGQTEFGTVNLLCIILGRFRMLVWIVSPHTCFCTCFLFGDKKYTKTSGTNNANNKMNFIKLSNHRRIT